jgi:hypothetical protein
MPRSEPENLDRDITGENDTPVTIAHARTEFEASMIVSILTDAGIEAHAFDRFRQALPFQSSFSGIPVQVRAADETRAKEALAQRVEDSMDIDWDEVDLGEREDTLPLGTVGRPPVAAQIAFSIAVVLIFLTLLLGLMALLF